jgi:hypothetical protein
MSADDGVSSDDSDSDANVPLRTLNEYAKKNNFQLHELKHNYVIMVAGAEDEPWLALVSDNRIGTGVEAYTWAKYMQPKVTGQPVGEWKVATGKLVNFRIVKRNPKLGQKGCANDVPCPSIIAIVQWCVRGITQDVWCRGATVTKKEWESLLNHCTDLTT